MNNVLKITAAVVGSLAGYLAITAGAYLPFVISDAKKNFRDECEYLMILGGLVIGADTPSPHLEERINCAAEYLKENTTCFAVPCGGCFREHQKVSEAQIIADRLIEKGIDRNRIIVENKSTTTVENFKFAFEIIRNHSSKNINDLKIAFLSSDFHMHRAALIAKKSGLQKPLRVSCPTGKDALRHYVREYFVAYGLLNIK